VGCTAAAVEVAISELRFRTTLPASPEVNTFAIAALEPAASDLPVGLRITVPFLE
jgi:hypothetical protein